MSDSDTENSASARRISVPAVMTLAIALGFVVGYMVGIFVAPTLAIVFGLGGAMSFGACAVAFFLFRSERSDAYEINVARTGEEARKK